MKKLAFLVWVTLSLVACKRDEDVPPGNTTPPTTASVNLSVTLMNGTELFDPSEPFTVGSGQLVRVTVLKYYMHNVSLTDEAGVTVAQFPGRILLVDGMAATNTFALGTMAPAHVHNVQFSLGLDSASSYGFPDQTTAPPPLNAAEMTWAWNTAAGRMFVKLEGFVDANANNVQDPGEAFEFHGIGPDMVPVPDQLLIPRDAIAGGTVDLTAKVDIASLFASLDLPSTNHNDDAQVQQLMQNLAAALQPM